MLFKVSNLLLFNEDRLGVTGLRPWFRCICVRKQLALCHGTVSVVDIIRREDITVIMKGRLLFFP